MTTIKHLIIDKKNDVYLKIDTDEDIRRELAQFLHLKARALSLCLNLEIVLGQKIRLFSYQMSQIYVDCVHILKCEDNNVQVVDGTKIQDVDVRV